MGPILIGYWDLDLDQCANMGLTSPSRQPPELRCNLFGHRVSKGHCDSSDLESNRSYFWTTVRDQHQNLSRTPPQMEENSSSMDPISNHHEIALIRIEFRHVWIAECSEGFVLGCSFGPSRLHKIVMGGVAQNVNSLRQETSDGSRTTKDPTCR